MKNCHYRRATMKWEDEGEPLTMELKSIERICLPKSEDIMGRNGVRMKWCHITLSTMWDDINVNLFDSPILVSLFIQATAYIWIKVECIRFNFNLLRWGGVLASAAATGNILQITTYSRIEKMPIVVRVRGMDRSNTHYHITHINIKIYSFYVLCLCVGITKFIAGRNRNDFFLFLEVKIVLLAFCIRNEFIRDDRCLRFPRSEYRDLNKYAQKPTYCIRARIRQWEPHCTNQNQNAQSRFLKRAMCSARALWALLGSTWMETIHLFKL